MSSTSRTLAWAAAVGFAFAAWLAAPLHERGERRGLRIAVFDRSASVERARPDHGEWMRATLAHERERARAEGSELAALVFAGDRAWWLVPGSAEREIPPPPRAGDPLASDLAGALELARSAADSSSASGGVVRVFSDARASGASPAGDLRALAARGWSVELGALPAPALDEVAIEELRAPERLEAGAPLACEVHLRAALRPGVPGPRSLSIELGWSAGGQTRASFERTLEAGASAGVWRFDLGEPPAGSVRIEAHVSLAGDPIPENDRASRWVEVGGALAIAVVAPDPPDPTRGPDEGRAAAAAFLADPAAWPGLAFVPVTVAELPGVLPHVRAVLSLDVDPARLPLDALASFLEAGGGWLHAAGASALRSEPDSAPGRRARELLPLGPELPPRPARDVLLLIDGSGSMAGEAFDAVRAAALRLAQAVPARDRLLLAFFRRELEPPLVLRDAGADRSVAVDLSALLGARGPGGGTDVLGVLEELAESRSEEANAMLALLLSDGRDPSAPQNLDPREVRERLAAARVELQVFAFGPDADTRFLASLLPPGRELAHARDAASLTALFEQAIDGERVRRDVAVVAGSQDAFAPRSLAAELAPALAAGAPRSLECAWLAGARTGADVLWRSQQGEPLLALQRVGSGASAAFASLPVEGWASAARAPAALGPLLRALAREGAEGPRLPRAELAGGRFFVRGLPVDSPLEVLARLPGGGTWTLVPPTALVDEPRTTRAVQVAAEELPAAFEGNGVIVLGSKAGAVLGSVTLERPAAPEFSAPVSSLEAAPAGGNPAPRGKQPHPAAAWVLAGSAALLAVALFLGLSAR